MAPIATLLVNFLIEITDDAAGSDWSAYAPVVADFTPELKPAPPGEPALAELSATPGATPLIRVRTWDDRVYVSSDEASTFRELCVDPSARARSSATIRSGSSAE